MIIFLFGRPWSGKTRIGRELARTLGTTFKDGDDWYSEDEKRRITRGEFTWNDSKKFFDHITTILSQFGGDRMLVLSGQSLFLRAYRQELKDRFGDSIFLIYLDVPKEVTLQRAALPRIFGGKEHFYGFNQYKREFDEYEEAGPYDLKVENIGLSEKAVQMIVRGIAEHFRGKVKKEI